MTFIKSNKQANNGTTNNRIDDMTIRFAAIKFKLLRWIWKRQTDRKKKNKKKTIGIFVALLERVRYVNGFSTQSWWHTINAKLTKFVRLYCKPNDWTIFDVNCFPFWWSHWIERVKTNTKQKTQRCQNARIIFCHPQFSIPAIRNTKQFSWYSWTNP